MLSINSCLKNPSSLQINERYTLFPKAFCIVYNTRKRWSAILPFYLIKVIKYNYFLSIKLYIKYWFRIKSQYKKSYNFATSTAWKWKKIKVMSIRTVISLANSKYSMHKRRGGGGGLIPRRYILSFMLVLRIQISQVSPSKLSWDLNNQLQFCKSVIWWKSLSPFLNTHRRIQVHQYQASWGWWMKWHKSEKLVQNICRRQLEENPKSN